MLAREHSDLVVVVAGDGPLREDLVKRAQRSAADVRFMGWVDDLPRLYASLDVVVLTSRNEGTPVALIEASAAGRPVVATDVGGVSDVVRDGYTGILVPPMDVAAVSAALDDLLRNPNRARTMGLAGRHWVRERFSRARMVEDVCALYRELLDTESL